MSSKLKNFRCWSNKNSICICRNSLQVYWNGQHNVTFSTRVCIFKYVINQMILQSQLSGLASELRFFLYVVWWTIVIRTERSRKYIFTVKFDFLKILLPRLFESLYNVNKELTGIPSQPNLSYFHSRVVLGLSDFINLIFCRCQFLCLILIVQYLVVFRSN